MSGYRTLHRSKGYENTSKCPTPIWSISFSPCAQSRSKPKPPVTNVNPPHRLLSCHADGIIRAYSIHDKSILSSSSEQITDATALSMSKQDELRPSSSPVSLSDSSTSNYAPLLGSCQISVVRNHVGESNTSGEEIVASISLDGWIRIWKREEQPTFLSTSEKESGEISNPIVQFQVHMATGTNIALSPVNWGGKSLIVAIGCRDGSVMLCETGIPVNNGSTVDDKKDKKATTQAGVTITQLTGNKSTITSISFSHNGSSLAIGRKDGTVDMYSVKSDFRRLYHVIAHWGPIRALEFTADDALLLTGGDDGKVNAYDIVQRKNMALVRQFVGHMSWILDISACPDGRRFATSSSDKSVRIWDLSIRDSVHTFDGHTDQVWGVSFNEDGARLASCGDDGMIQIYSCDI